MKNQQLYTLKQTLYPFFDYFKNDLTVSEIDDCQFFDINPSRLVWDYYLSSQEKTIRQFGTEIHLVKKFSYHDEERDRQNLLEIFEKDDLFQLFMSRDYAVQLPKKLLIKVLESLHFFQNSDCILVGLTSKNIVSGDSNGFSLWQNKKWQSNKKSIMDYAGSTTGLYGNTTEERQNYLKNERDSWE